MRVYSIRKNKEQQILQIQIIRRFEVFDLVTITFKNGEQINGEIIFIESKSVQVTGPCGPIETFLLEEIDNIERWDAPEDWEYLPRGT